MHSTIKLSVLTTLLALGTAACGGDKRDGGDSAFLTIVGDKNVYLDNSEVQKLRVRYHDGEDRPLAGTVDFRIVGTSGGAILDKNAGITSDDGVVEIAVETGESGAASFQIEATAYSASPARWTVSVGNGVPDLDPSGRYQVSSKLDIISGLDSDAGKALNIFADMTDGDNDPAEWIVDQALASDDIPDWIKLPVSLAKPIIVVEFNEFLLQSGFVSDLVEIGEAFGDVTRNFGLTTQLDIVRNQGGDVDDPQFEADHLVTGVFFDILGEPYAWTMEDLDVEDIEAEKLVVSKDNKNMLILGTHELPVSYGAAIKLALEKGIIPLFDDQANTLAGFLHNQIDCENVGQSIYDEIGGNADIYDGLCDFGLEVAAGVIIDQILKIDDTGVLLKINGIARPRDTNGDRKVDQLQAGKWNGAIYYAGSESTLDPEVNTFTGTRLTAVP